MLILAGALQGNSPGWLSIKGGRPDFLLVALISTSLTLDPTKGAVLGFVAGLIHGSIIGTDIGSYIVSRTIIGFVAGMINIRFFSDNPVVPVLSAGVLTFMGEGFFLLASPPANPVAELDKILFISLFNSLLTLVAFWILKWIEVRQKIRKASARV